MLPKISYPFLDLDFPRAKQEISRTLRRDYKTVKAFHEGDHWQEGAGWVGPMPQSDEDGYDETVEQIKRAFTSRNVVREGTERHKTGILGREPRWELLPKRPMKADEKPKEEEQRLIDEAEALLTTWWNERGIQDLLQAAVQAALWANRSTVRLYVPRGLLTSVGVRGDGSVVKGIKAATMEEALELVYLEVMDAEQAMVYVDPDSKKKLGMYVFTDAEEGSQNMELTWIDDLGMTILRLVKEGAAPVDGHFSFNYGRRLPMYMLEHPGLINDAVLQNQRALNLALSMTPRNVVTGGFLERVLLNAQMPGDWEYDENGERTRFIPEAYVTGSGTTNFVRGIDYTDEDGKTHMANPSVHWREPIDVKGSIEAKEAHYLNILDEIEQAHILTTSSQFQSGKSKEQARAGFMASLNITRGRVDSMGAWLLETVLAMAEQFIGQPGKYTSKLRVVFNSKPDYGPLTADERRIFNEAMEAGVISRERNMYMQGVDDVDAEIAKINAEQYGNFERTRKALEVMGMAESAKVSIEIVCKMMGLDEELTKEIVAAAEEIKKEQEAKAKAEADQQMAMASLKTKQVGPNAPAKKKE